MADAAMELLLAPVGAGKTESAQDRILALKRAQPLARVWVLLPTERQITAFRARLIARARAELTTRTLFNVEFFNFYSLYSHLLAQAGRPQRCLDGTARQGVLRGILRDLDASGQLPTFTRVVHTSGFAQITGDFLYELKQNLIEPQAFTDAAVTPKERELALIYTDYQQLLQTENLVDREGEGWLALAALTGQADGALDIEVDLLVADGYDQFTLLQASLLAQLAARARAALITLTTVPGREATVGRRFENAQTRLLALLRANALSRMRTVQTRTIDSAFAERADLDRHPILRALTARLFISDADPIAREETLAAGDSATASATPVVQFLEAPDIWGETGLVLRRVKALLLAGSRPDEVLIAVRDWPLYGGALVAQARGYGLPFTAQMGEPLAENPAVVAFMALLGLAPGDFRRREVLAVLRSPYFDLDGLRPETIDAIERAATARLVLGGRAEWLTAVEAEIAEAERLALEAQLQTADANAAADEDDSLVSPQRLSLDEWRAAYAALVRFFDAITPPEQAVLGEYIDWIERLIPPDKPLDDEAMPNTAPSAYCLNMPLRARDLIGMEAMGEAGEAITARDMSALCALVGTLRALLSAGDLLAALNLDPTARAPMRFRDFYASLRAAVDSTEGDRRSSGGRDGRILITTAAEARGLPHAHVFIVGLSEGLFPARTPEDPLLLDSERDAFDARLAYPDRRLLRRADRADEPGLFYEVVGQARASVTFSRPTLKEAAPWIESHLWRAAWALFETPTLETMRAGDVLAPDTCATPAEAALAAAHHLAQVANSSHANGASENGASPVSPEATLTRADFSHANFSHANFSHANFSRLHGWLGGAHPALWAHIRRARAHEARRAARDPHDHYSGRLRYAPLIAAVTQRLGADRLWSASQLNEAGTCGYRFFAGRLLALKPIRKPEEGVDVLQLGQVYHAILEQTYAAIRKDGIAVTPANTQAALDLLDGVAARVLADAPRAFGFRATLWANESATIQRRLRALVTRDFAGEMLKDAAEPRMVDQIERKFQFTLPLDRSGPIAVRGRFDRIDQVGARRVIIDYKSGSTAIRPHEIASGRNFQMLVYLLAAHDLYSQHDGEAVVTIDGQFWHLSGFKVGGALTLSDETHAEVLQPGLDRIDANIQAGRAGDFSAQRNGSEAGRCYRYCDFHALCRMSVLHAGKRPHDVPLSDIAVDGASHE